MATARRVGSRGSGTERLLDLTLRRVGADDHHGHARRVGSARRRARTSAPSQSAGGDPKTQLWSVPAHDVGRLPALGGANHFDIEPFGSRCVPSGAGTRGGVLDVEHGVVGLELGHPWSRDSRVGLLRAGRFAAFISMTTVVPWPSALSTVRVPPMRSISRLDRARPMPVPSMPESRLLSAGGAACRYIGGIGDAS
jgi:hypothetical protein